MHTSRMIDEVYRVLAPGSRFVTFSLHAANEVVGKYDKPDVYQWRVMVSHTSRKW